MSAEWTIGDLTVQEGRDLLGNSMDVFRVSDGEAFVYVTREEYEELAADPAAFSGVMHHRIENFRRRCGK